MRYELDDLAGIVQAGLFSKITLCWFNNPNEPDGVDCYCSCCGRIDPENPEAVSNVYL